MAAVSRDVFLLRLTSSLSIQTVPGVYGHTADASKQLIPTQRKLGGHFSRLLWIAAGIAPAILFGTRFLMYWNRVTVKRSEYYNQQLQLSPALSTYRGRATSGLPRVKL